MPRNAGGEVASRWPPRHVSRSATGEAVRRKRLQYRQQIGDALGLGLASSPRWLAWSVSQRSPSQGLCRLPPADQPQ